MSTLPAVCALAVAAVLLAACAEVQAPRIEACVILNQQIVKDNEGRPWPGMVLQCERVQ